MKVSKKINLSTYSCNIHLIITDNLSVEVNRIYKKNKSDEKFEDAAEGIVVSLDITNYYVILDLKYLTHNTIAHEVYHSAVDITEDRGVKDEEARAWLVGHITLEMYKFIEKKNLNITHGR